MSNPKTKKNTRKGNVTWKLKDLPTARELSDLVSNDILTVDEAREIVLGDAENDKAKIESLEALVEYLQGLVSELAKKSSTTYIPYERTIYIDRAVRPYWDRYWMNTHTVLCKAGLNVDSSVNKLTTTSGGTGLKLNGASYGGVAKGTMTTGYVNTTGSSGAVYAVNNTANIADSKFNGSAITLSVANTDVVS